MTKETLYKAIKLESDCNIITDVLKEIERTNVLSKDLVLTLDPDTYNIVIAIVKETLRDTLRYKNKELEKL